MYIAVSGENGVTYGGRRPGYNNFALGKATVAACPIQIDDVRLPPGYWA
ncbi:MAG: hypothetical protein ABSA59_25195 [Terriglobia bacterium]